MQQNNSFLLQRVAAQLPEQVRRVLVGVSGGVDSVVLLHLLKRLSADLNLELAAAHLDHGLRRQSHLEAHFVATLCRDWGIPCTLGRRDVSHDAEVKKISLEMAGRNARRQFLRTRAVEFAAQLIALGHHCNDQTETFLLRLLRGSGSSGLGCMRVEQDGWWRPLLDCSRRQILEYARANGLCWVEDESNLDPAFHRNRLRNQVLPLLRDMNPQFDRGISTLIRQFQVEEDYWGTLVNDHFARLLLPASDGLRLSREGLLSVHRALRLRLYREALNRVRGHLQRIEAGHLRDIESLLTGSRSQSQIDLPDAWVARRYHTLWFRQTPPLPPAPLDVALKLPGTLRLENGRVLRANLQSRQQSESPEAVEFDFDQLQGPVRVRQWQPGDCFAPVGMVGQKKLKRFFSDQKVELEIRSRTLVVVAGQTVLWIVGMRRSRHAPVIAETRKILRLELI